jgi:hypothetical protein
MSPSFVKGSDKQTMLDILDRANKYDMRVIVTDYRTDWRLMTSQGEETYRSLFAQAMEDFGSHPAVMGFYIGDEPNVEDIEDALKAVRIHRELAPKLTPYLNLLPWFDWIGKRMGTPALAPYLDRVVKEGVSMLSYDCYTQMWDGDQGWNDYFYNLREYYLATRRLSVPFQSILLSIGHYYYRCPNENEMRWQLSTAVAHGASGISWFFINLTDINENYRNPAIDQFGHRTQSFEWLSTTNCLFQSLCGEIMTGLKVSDCYHVNKTYGGMPLFHPFGKVRDISSEHEVPLIISEFKDKEDRLYWMIVNNSMTECTLATIKFVLGTKLQMCKSGNVFGEVPVHTDPIGEREGEGNENVNLWLAPGQLVLLREDPGFHDVYSNMMKGC